MKKVGIYISLLCAISVSSCTLFGNGDGDPLPEGVYAGIYSQGIEDSIFEPCGEEDEVWQLNFPNFDEFFEKFNEVEENPVYVELRGTPSEKGSYEGIFQTYDRRMEVEETLEVKSLQFDGCP